MKTRAGHLFKRNGIYYVQWRVAGKLYMKSTGTRNRREAERRRREIMAPFAAGSEVDVLRNVAARIEGREAEIAALDEQQNPPLKVADAWRAFTLSTNRPDTGESTLRQYEFQWRHFARWMESRQPGATLQDVTGPTAEEYAAELIREGKAHGTYNKYLNLMRLVFRVLKKKGRLTENPWDEIPRKNLNADSRRELTIEELRCVCEAATGEMRPLFALGIYTGLRLGDCATLQWCEADLKRGRITRVPNKTARRNKKKSVKVPIHPVLAAMLAETPSRKRRGNVLPGIAAEYDRRIDSVTDKIQAHFEACGIRTQKKGTGKYRNAEGDLIDTGKRAVVEVGFHSLRHTFVSLCRDSNAPLSVVESIVGHSNPAMTQHYTHVGEVAADAAVAALPYVTGEAVAEPSPAATVDAETVRGLARKLTSRNAGKIKQQLLKLVG